MRFAGTGDVYVGDYSDDELTGDGTMHYGLTGDVYTGMWLRGRVKHTHTHTQMVWSMSAILTLGP